MFGFWGFDFRARPNSIQELLLAVSRDQSLPFTTTKLPHPPSHPFSRSHLLHLLQLYHHHQYGLLSLFLNTECSSVVYKEINRAQDSLLDLCSGISPDHAMGTIWDFSNKTRVSCLQDKMNIFTTRTLLQMNV